MERQPEKPVFENNPYDMMDRRHFIKISALSSLPALLQGCDWSTTSQSYGIDITSDMQAGHLVFSQKGQFAQGKTENTRVLIIGGGMAGLSAAYNLKDRDFMLCELSEGFGGSSGSHNYKGNEFAQGAHYDLSYPVGYGTEVLELLHGLDIIIPQSWKGQWGFKDRQHIIPYRLKNQCYENGKFRKEVLADGKAKDHFLKLISQYVGKMPMPTRLIDKDYRGLNDISFTHFLNSKGIKPAPSFLRGLDYHMLDDFGGTAQQVSALAGIHYFACRPYYNEVVELFSPPEGNAYFANKLIQKLPQKQLLDQHLVTRVSEVGNGFETEVIDLKARVKKKIKSEKIIYAGQKHALKYIYPAAYPLFSDNTYAPWMVINFVLEDTSTEYGFWQNEMLVKDQSFMGFIDSNAHTAKLQNHRVLTAYYCLPPSSRKNLANINKAKTKIVSNTITYINTYFNTNISKKIKKVYIKAMGHAMPIPVPGYLFDDKNAHRLNKNMAFAGVDNARLPLLFEALDSGIRAVKSLDL